MTREEILKTAKPILFNTEMVRAIKDGRKTVTRRAVKPQPVVLNSLVIPPYKVGDYLYVRETWTPFCINKSTCVNALLSHSDFCFKASLDSKIYGCCDTLSCKWHPSIHMPKEAARIFLRITDVRVERLQDIITGDYKTPININKEGLILPCTDCKHINGDCKNFIVQNSCILLDEFKKLWNSTVKKSDLDHYGWDANPWVWVIEFERVEVTE